MGNIFSSPSPPVDSRVVETEYGRIRGRRLTTKGNKLVDAFQGIPYARPPIGPLRFKKPVKPKRWNDIKETKAFGPKAIHAMEPHTKSQEGNEDCLYLNVFAPAWEPPKDTGFPVMVFIHGGAFEMGDAPTYGDVNICENIVPDDVIFVTIQYRLGYLGFFSTGDEVCPGNIGLWDQVAALKWIKNNIENFGGDKLNITLLGLSAGGASVDMLHCSPHSTDLFDRAILMAGTAECRWALNQSMPAQCRAKAELLVIREWQNSEELLDKLRAVPAEKLAVIYKEGIKMAGADFETVALIDGDFFPAPMDELRKRATPKPMMTGVTKEEGLLFILDKQPTEEHLREMITLAAQDGKDKQMLAKVLREQYVGAVTPADKEAFMRCISRLASDYFVNAGVLETCRKTLALQKEPVFLYVLTHHNPGSMGENEERLPLIDCTHTSEVQYLFASGRFATPTFTEADLRVTRLFTQAFTNFAKFGNPNGAESVDSHLGVEWRAIDRGNYRNLVFSSEETSMDESFFRGRTTTYLELTKSL